MKKSFKLFRFSIPSFSNTARIYSFQNYTFNFSPLTIKSIHSFPKQYFAKKMDPKQKKKQIKEQIKAEYEDVESLDILLNDLNSQFMECNQNFEQDLKQIKTGRANINIFENIKVLAYGKKNAFNDVCKVIVKGNNQLTIIPFDPSLKNTIITTLETSDFDLQLSSVGDKIEAKIMKSNSQAKKLLLDEIKAQFEAQKTTLRAIRNNAVTEAKRKLSKIIPLADLRNYENEIENHFKKSMEKANELYKKKEKEIMSY